MDRVQDALLQLQDLKRRLLGRQLFMGYSGPARMAGGLLALAGAFIMSQNFYPQAVMWHIIGWGSVAFLSAAVNYAAVVYWYLKKNAAERKMQDLLPALESLPSLAAGGILTFALINAGAANLLFGTWMCLFGLVNTSSHHYLPRKIELLGWFYIAAGAVCFLKGVPFLNPWPMACVFFTGEALGGFLFFWHRQDHQERQL